MKYILLIFMFFILLLNNIVSCLYAKEIQVIRRGGHATKIEYLARFNGVTKRIQWTLDNKVVVYQYVNSTDTIVKVGDYENFMTER